MDLEGLELCKTAALKMTLTCWESELEWEQQRGEKENRLAWIREQIAEIESKLEKRSVPKEEMRVLTRRERTALAFRDNERHLAQELTSELEELKKELDYQVSHKRIAELQARITEIENELQKRNEKGETSNVQE